MRERDLAVERPRGLSVAVRGEVEIPLGSRIIAVCDAFDAMISNRPYAPPKTIDDALAELRRHAGAQFDASIVPIFEQVIADRAKSPTANAGA